MPKSSSSSDDRDFATRSSRNRFKDPKRSRHHQSDEKSRKNSNKGRKSRSRSPDRRTERRRRSREEDEFLSPMQKRIKEGIKTEILFDAKTCEKIERKINEVCEIAERGGFKTCTVDRAPLRNKYFFGEGYIYGNQLKTKGPGQEKLYPKGECDEIPQWIFDLVVKPVEEAGFIPEGFVNSAVINDYLPGGCIVSHIDPPQIFDRPIVTASFLSATALSFGCRFSYRPMRTTKPVLSVPLSRGCVMSMQGYAADNITHCVRPDDITERRAVVILRHVPDDAPRLTPDELEELRENGQLPPNVEPRKIKLFNHEEFQVKEDEESSYERECQQQKKISKSQLLSKSAPKQQEKSICDNEKDWKTGPNNRYEPLMITVDNQSVLNTNEEIDESVVHGKNGASYTLIEDEYERVRKEVSILEEQLKAQNAKVRDALKCPQKLLKRKNSGKFDQNLGSKRSKQSSSSSSNDTSPSPPPRS